MAAEIAINTAEPPDPRIRRTRQLLQDALRKLLKQKEFDKISVQDIAAAATVNRATFYDHYTDKFALLECMVASRFQELLAKRNITFDCSSALQGIAQAVCDFLSGTASLDPDRQRHTEPHLEYAIIAVVRSMILEGLQQHRTEASRAPEMTATALSWAIYGAAQEWARQPRSNSSEEIAQTISVLVAPLLNHAH